MGVADKYRAIYKREMEAPVRGLIYAYSPVSKTYEFHPFRHNCENCGGTCADDCAEKLGDLLRKDLVFYAYGEDEVVKRFEDGLFSDLEQAAVFAYKNRLPDRKSQIDGLPGEVLLDLLIQNMIPNAYKLAARTLFRQQDNNEIKGYDLTYFSLENGRVSLWLGQAKMGAKDYCKAGINGDLIEKFTKEYLNKQLFFVCEKSVEMTDECKQLTSEMTKLSIATINYTPEQRALGLIQYLIDNNITVNIPCLMAYGEGSVYSDIDALTAAMEAEIKSFSDYFSSRTYEFNGFQPNIIFLVFPLKDLSKLRGDGGFYVGLR
jgi:hypothetical protein